MKKKMLTILMIITILFSVVIALFSKKSYAVKAKGITETTINPTALLTIYAEAGAGLKEQEEWAKENGFDISTIKNQKYVLNFEKAIKDEYKNFNSGHIEISDASAILNWYAILTSSLTGNDTLLSDISPVPSFKEMGMNINDIRLVAAVNADGNNYELDTGNPIYTPEQIVEIFQGDIIDTGSIIEFSDEGVTATAISSDSKSQDITNIVKIEIKEKVFVVTDKDGNEVEALILDCVTYLENLDNEDSEENYVKTENIKITKDGKEVDLFSNSNIKNQLAKIEFNANIGKFVINYTENEVMDVDDVHFKVIDGDNNTWYFALGTDLNFYLVNDKAFNTEFDTTLDYSAIINTKEVSGTKENQVFLPNYDKNDVEKDADVTAIIKSANGDNIVTVNGKAMDNSGKPNEDGWYYANTNDKTTISKNHLFDKYDNLEDNGIVPTETVELGNEDGLTSTETVQIKWPFRIIKVTQDPENIDDKTEKVRVEITTNLPIDKDKLPEKWQFTTDEEGKTQHRIYREFEKGENYEDDVVVKANGRDDTAKTPVSIKWPEKKPSGLPKTGESIMILGAVILLIGITVFIKKKSKNN